MERQCKGIGLGPLSQRDVKSPLRAFVGFQKEDYNCLFDLGLSTACLKSLLSGSDFIVTVIFHCLMECEQCRP